MLLLNLKTLYVADDYVYRFVYQSPTPTDVIHPERINTFLIPHSMWNHYLLWNGRFVAHSIVQYFMQFNSKVPFDICSSLIYVLLILLMNKFSTKLSNRSDNAWILPLIFFFTWFYIPYFGQSVLWLSGSGNYLWMSIIYLGFILFNLQDNRFNMSNSIIAIILGFLAGATNENSGPAAVLIVLLFMLKRFIQDRKISLVSVIGVIFSGIGFILMVMSPGSQKRAAVHQTWETIQNNFTGIYKLTFGKWVWIYLLIAMLLIVAILMKRITKGTFWSVVIFLIGHLAAVYSMAFSPEYPERTFFGGVIFLGIALFIILYTILDDVKVPLVISAVLGIVFLFSFWPAYQDINLSYHQMQVQYHIIYKAERTKEKHAVIPLMTMQKSKYNANYGVIALDTPPQALMNQWEAKFFGVNQISGYRVNKSATVWLK